MRCARSLVGMTLILILAWSLAWAAEPIPIPMFGDYKILQFDGPISPTRGAFKAAENESPLPQDRVFLHYNYWDDITGLVSRYAVAQRPEPAGQKIGRST